MDTHQFVGIHFVASYSGCDISELVNVDGLKNAMRLAVEASGATILGHADYIFKSDAVSGMDGYTLVYVLSESHASIHTYPEVSSCFVDLFTCGTHCDYQQFDKSLQSYLHPSSTTCSVIRRDADLKIIDFKSSVFT